MGIFQNSRTIRALTLLGALLLVGVTPVRAASEKGDDLIERYRDILTRQTRDRQDMVMTHVDYTALMRDPKWEALVQALGRSHPDDLATREEQLAFWINAYNILAIDMVVRHYPVKSIKDVGSFFSSVWTKAAGEIGGETYSLDDIEHGILRPMGDARIHGAIVCASVSCPPLSRDPFVAGELDAQLDAALVKWLANPYKGARVDRQESTLYLSRVFDWFEEDFREAGGVRAFVARYLSPADAAWLRSRVHELRIEYLDYDWRLND